MVAEIIPLLAAASGGGVFTLLGQSVRDYFKSRADVAINHENTTADVQKQRDNLTLELLHTAREEASAARIEAAEYRRLQIRLIHFEEALDHIEAMHTAADPADRAAADKRAALFLVRMKRFQEAAGTMKNETQHGQSKAAVLGDILREGFKGTPDE